MGRIRFALPDRFAFSTQIQICISHVNRGGHLDNAQLLTLVSEVRVRFFKSLGYRESDVAGCPIMVGVLVAQYTSEGFHGETMRPQDFMPLRLRPRPRLRRPRHAQTGTDGVFGATRSAHTGALS